MMYKIKPHKNISDIHFYETDGKMFESNAIISKISNETFTFYIAYPEEKTWIGMCIEDSQGEIGMAGLDIKSAESLVLHLEKAIAELKNGS